MNRVTKKLACVFMTGMIGTGLLAGCGSNIDGTKALLTCGEDTVSIGTGNLMLRVNQAQMQAYYAMMGGNAAGIWEQDAGDGTTRGESTKNMVVEQLKQGMLLKQHAEEYKVALTEEETKKIEEAAKAFIQANKEETLTKLAVNQENVEELLEFYTYQEKMYEPMTADVDTKVEDSEAQQSAISYCRFDISDKKNEDGTTTPLTAEEKQEKKDQAQKLLDQLKVSKDPATDMDALVKKIDDKMNAYNTTFDSEDTLLDKKVKEAAVTLSKDGQVYDQVIEGEDSYFVLCMDRVLDREATDQEKENIVSRRKQEAYGKLLEDWEKEAKIKVNETEWKKVKLTDRDQYMIKQPEAEKTEK